jgi:hypothetical protein
MDRKLKDFRSELRKIESEGRKTIRAEAKKPYSKDYDRVTKQLKAIESLIEKEYTRRSEPFRREIARAYASLVDFSRSLVWAEPRSLPELNRYIDKVLAETRLKLERKLKK